MFIRKWWNCLLDIRDDDVVIDTTDCAVRSALEAQLVDSNLSRFLYCLRENSLYDFERSISVRKLEWAIEAYNVMRETAKRHGKL